MKSIKSSILIATLGTLFAFLSVAYMSCSKAILNPALCQDLICQHGGHCYSDTVASSPRYNTHYCICPLGYEDQYCATSSSAKFLGSWTVIETYTGSNNPGSVGITKTYTTNITLSSTPYIFNINGLGNYPILNVQAYVDSNINTQFIIQAFTPVANGNTHVLSGIGAQSAGVDMWGLYYYNWQNSNFHAGFVNETDTITFTMHKNY